jgi:hypothetical protein
MHHVDVEKMGEPGDFAAQRCGRVAAEAPGVGGAEAAQLVPPLRRPETVDEAHVDVGQCRT